MWVALFVFIGKLASAAKEMAIAWRYGVSETVDAYVFVFNLINLPVSVWFSVLTAVLLPIVARIRHNDPAELPRFRSELLGLTMLVGLGLGCLVWFGLPALLRAGWLGLSDQALAKALHMARGLALLAPLGVLISLLSAWLLAHALHRNTLFEGIPALIILVVLLLPPGWLPEPLVRGTVAGFALHMGALAAPLWRRGELQAPTFVFSSPAWQGFRASIGIMAAGQVLMSFTGIIDQFFAAGLGSGALSTLSYANRILALILGIIATAIGRATLTIFSESAARGSADTWALALRWAWWMFSAGSAIVLIGWIGAPWVVSLLFERGAFTATDSAHVSVVLQYALIQIPFYAFAMALVSCIASQKQYGVLLISGMIGLVVKIIAAVVLTRFMRLEGLAFSTTFIYLANAIFFIFLANQKKAKYE